MTDLRVAVWGLGPHALKNLVPAVRASVGINLIGVCSRNEAVVRQTAAAFGCHDWTDPAVMLDDPNVDVVVLATPTGLHADHGKAVLTAGKHLWCEKPVTHAAALSEELVTLSRARQLTLGEGFMYLYHPQFVRLQQLVHDGKLGAIHTINCRFGIPKLDRASFRDCAELGGGAFLDVGAYPISVVAALFPDTQPEVSSASIKTRTGATVDTHGRAVLRYPNDVIATLEWRTQSAYRNEIDIWGDGGSVWTDRLFSKSADYAPRFYFRDQRGEASEEPSRAENHFISMFAAFRHLIDDPSAAEQERSAITHRARIAERIRQQSLSV